jgi:hypothetical protein
MRRFSLATLAFILVTSLTTGAQAAVPGDSGRQPSVSAKGVDLAGKVSNDGKALLADDDNSWSVSNASMLKGFEGRHVTVKCRMDLSRHAIQVLYVVQPATTHGPNLADSAFRR